MKNKKVAQYGLFRKKLIVKLFTVFCVSTLGIILVRSLVTGKAGQLIADLIAVWLRLDEVTAARIYFLTVGNLTEPLMAIVILIAMFVSLVLFSKHFTAYFNELADKLTSYCFHCNSLCADTVKQSDNLTHYLWNLKLNLNVNENHNRADY